MENKTILTILLAKGDCALLEDGDDYVMMKKDKECTRFNKKMAADSLLDDMRKAGWE